MMMEYPPVNVFKKEKFKKNRRKKSVANTIEESNEFHVQPIGEELSTPEQTKKAVSIDNIVNSLPLFKRDNKPIEIRPMPNATEAHLRHDAEDPYASIVTSFCGEGNNACKYKEDCPILAGLDERILEFLNNNVIISPEVKWCGFFDPQKPVSYTKRRG